eukprot:CAMPEP_0202977222 /NCGR_PEP_ID=MMETSP1396-20130829/84129_1 /ASSEMBLY_ACC=CAM_ASM_000872 /TAXON_ID= /ORGANISM="Pseudokeronopsis sp., Strain Brazil" /LENGTH=175 /DNA_ID=CAMNT_0049715943 /DNA_START=481 /DNA_END=1005 /DNA_ORIENTATION=+
MSYVADGGWGVMGEYEMDHGSLALEFVVDPRDTKMYGSLGDEAFFFEDHQFTYNSHHWSINPETFETDAGLGDEAFFFEDHQFTYNSHHWSINPETFETDEGLKSMFHVTAISYMPEPDGRPIVASVESEKYPFFGTQFHPEKSTQVFLEDSGIDHSWLGIRMNAVFNDYFVYLA